MKIRSHNGLGDAETLGFESVTDDEASARSVADPDGEFVRVSVRSSMRRADHHPLQADCRLTILKPAQVLELFL